MVASALKKQKRPRKHHAGMFQKGKSGNPSGKPGIYQDFVTRARHLLEEYTAQQIVDIVSNKDKKQWSIPARDLMIMMDIADAFMKDGGSRSRALLDRVLGKPTETHVVNQNVNAVTQQHHIIQELDSWLKDITGDGAEAPTTPALP